MDHTDSHSSLQIPTTHPRYSPIPETSDETCVSCEIEPPDVLGSGEDCVGLGEIEVRGGNSLVRKELMSASVTNSVLTVRTPRHVL